ncbi:NAD(P)H-dependent flavin oxidoreductase [Xanthomonas fragariae]|uniref:NAD(P)H-dependent flavin oxidoreductase n=1 Tax=Xanthomonas fragariae TaxID=48664 RepID=UPI001ABE258D|nr:nitronate monooxygenase [Xanthomonas fragariae]UKR51807.1 nitronate monooxygenase [Xanthomonas fragariae]
MPTSSPTLTGPDANLARFCQLFGLRLPILLSPMAGACPVPLSAAVAEAGGMGAMGAVLSQPQDIVAWMTAFGDASAGPAQVNLWIPDPAPARDADAEAHMREFLLQWGPSVSEAACDPTPADFDAQFDALLDARPAVASSIMGVFRPDQVARLKRAGIAWFACATTLDEARAAQAAGADAVVAQGAEAGGHRGAFDASQAERQMTGLFALLPRLVDHLDIPVIAAGGIADARGIAAALMLGASAAQICTGLLRTPEAAVPSVWSDALVKAEPEQTQPTRAFSGRLGRALDTPYVHAARAADAPPPAPYPVQRGLTAPMRQAAVRDNHLDTMQAWAGQSAWMAPVQPAAQLVTQWWEQAQALLCR